MQLASDIPQARLPGAEAEVDWGRFDAQIGGETVTLHLISMWLAFSTNAFHRAYANEAQESFTDAHVRAFEWSKTFTDKRLAAAVVDRITYRAHIIQAGTTSCRLTNR